MNSELALICKWEIFEVVTFPVLFGTDFVLGGEAVPTAFAVVVGACASQPAKREIVVVTIAIMVFIEDKTTNPFLHDLYKPIDDAERDYVTAVRTVPTSLYLDSFDQLSQNDPQCPRTPVEGRRIEAA
ncbi:hypothetical protein Alches_25760 [Alicyclobacillus hesperidum subsp. aegles]|nr:hypothetical protein AAC03nite_31840 [Alicyclobacillus acidoterrestris]GLG02535.1 hypothetical protein Alches_25760 [Alicyclobacillus hesperidum subsp. aegles]